MKSYKNEINNIIMGCNNLNMARLSYLTFVHRIYLLFILLLQIRVLLFYRSIYFKSNHVVYIVRLLLSSQLCVFV